jgi:RND family efflux transporter MFP subunit
VSVTVVDQPWTASQFDEPLARLTAPATDRAGFLLQLVTRMASSRGLKDACAVLVNDFCGEFGWQRVAVALGHGKDAHCQVTAISGVGRFDPHSEYVRTLEAALNESVLRDATIIWPPLGQSAAPSLTHQKLSTIAGAECVVTCPLKDDAGQVIGAWVFLGPREFVELPAELKAITTAAKPVGAFLHLMERATRGPIARAAHALLNHGRFLPRRWLLAGAGLLAALLAVPWPYKIGSDCRIEPVTRRMIAVPFEGRLEKALVAPGDVVSPGQVVARMDGREIRWELAGLESELNAATKKRDSALATQNAATAQLAKLDMERLQLKIRLLESREDNLEIKSPIAGIVTSGDLEKAEGAPVATGATLFEIAPLDRMIAEVAVPEAEIAHVQTGLPVRIRLDAYPSRNWTATLDRIQPRAETREHENVFVAELSLDNSDELLRPGMKGQAKITGSRHSLAWILFHKAWESVAFALGW